MRLTRRHALFSAAALPFSGLARPALAKADKLGPATPAFHRFALGEFEVTTLLAGSRLNDKPR